MAVIQHIKDRAMSYYEPLFLVFFSVYYLIRTLLTHPLLPLTSMSEFRSQWFHSFWTYIGPIMAATPYQKPYISSLMGRARGTVLEFGPGSGDQSKHFRPKQIDHLYGAEPNVFLHDRLRENSTAAGIKSYTVLTCGAEPSTLIPALRRAGLITATGDSLPADGVFDTIVTVKSLCSAPQAEIQATVAIVQRLLRPGGEFIFFEHVHSHDDTITSLFVWLVNLFWPYLMGNCHLNGKLDEILRNQGGWASKDIQTIREYRGFEPIRYVKGVCRVPN